jgi:hypothetical protein
MVRLEPGRLEWQRDEVGTINELRRRDGVGEIATLAGQGSVQ